MFDIYFYLKIDLLNSYICRFTYLANNVINLDLDSNTICSLVTLNDEDILSIVRDFQYELLEYYKKQIKSFHKNLTIFIINIFKFKPNKKSNFKTHVDY